MNIVKQKGYVHDTLKKKSESEDPHHAEAILVSFKFKRLGKI